MKITSLIKNKKSKLYILFGLLNTLFAYFSGVCIYLLLESYLLDFVIFTLVSLINITFSYITMGIFVFNNNIISLGLGNFFKYFSSSMLNGIFGILLSTILIRKGIDIFFTQFLTILFNILLQLLINVFFLNNKK